MLNAERERVICPMAEPLQRLDADSANFPVGERRSDHFLGFVRRSQWQTSELAHPRAYRLQWRCRGRSVAACRGTCSRTVSARAVDCRAISTLHSHDRMERWIDYGRVYTRETTGDILGRGSRRTRTIGSWYKEADPSCADQWCDARQCNNARACFYARLHRRLLLHTCAAH